VGPFGCFALFGCSGGSGPDSSWAMTVSCEMGGFLAVGASSDCVGARLSFSDGAVEFLTVMVLGVVLFPAKFADRGGPAANRVVAELEAPLAVGGGVLSDVFSKGAFCAVEG